MKYNAGKDSEMSLVCYCIEEKAYKLFSQTENERNITEVLISVHLALREVDEQLANFRSINALWPKCSSFLQTNKENTSYSRSADGHLLFALHGLVDTLKPSADDVSSEKAIHMWLKRVHEARSVVEMTFQIYTRIPLDVTDDKNLLQASRATWCQLSIMKLFVECVCFGTEESMISWQQCTALWKKLEKEKVASVKEGETLKSIEEWLKLCCKVAKAKFFDKGNSCCKCERKIKGPPVELPCKHLLCEECFETKFLHLEQRTCLSCKEVVSNQWQPDTSAENWTAKIKFNRYQQCCNAFYMELVTQLCFDDHGPPSVDVIDRLLSYTFSASDDNKHFTRDISIFETGIDPNPVFRTYLLQMMIRSSRSTFYSLSEKFFDKARSCIQKSDGWNESLIEIFSLVCQCIEDELYQETRSENILQCCYKALDLAQTAFDEKTSSVIAKLTAVANMKFLLKNVTVYLGRYLTREGESVDEETLNMLRMTKLMFTRPEAEFPRCYLVKLICRQYNVEVYHQLSESVDENVNWIRVESLRQEEKSLVPDRFIICGDVYANIRDKVAQVFAGEDVSILEEAMKDCKGHSKETGHYLELAVFREITCTYAVDSKCEAKATTFSQSLEGCDFVANKDLIRRMLDNQLVPCSKLKISEVDNSRQRGIQCVLVHFLSVMIRTNEGSSVVLPFQVLMKTPETAKEMYLPTMPLDELEEVLDAIREAHKGNPYNNPAFWKCPNGHPYVVVDCGNRVQQARCNKCAANIGGGAEGNVKQDYKPKPSVGHILGHADTNSRVFAMRELSPIYVALLRLLTHFAMFLGIATDRKAIANLISPGIAEEECDSYIWSHIEVDVDAIKTVLASGDNLDDIFTLIHIVINRLAVYKQGSEWTDQYKFREKKQRQMWEQNFTKTLLKPVMENMTKTIAGINIALAQDTRLGAQPLLRHVYEVDNESENDNVDEIYANPCMWRYRTQVTFQHMCTQLEAKHGSSKEEFAVLKLFAEEDPVLQAMQYVPDILTLQRKLIFKYTYVTRIDRSEANEITVAQLIEINAAGDETERLIASFTSAWQIVREQLKTYVCVTEFDTAKVDTEYCESNIDDNTPLSVLLPTQKGPGLCSFALLDLLFRKQNNFLDCYAQLHKRDRKTIHLVEPQLVGAAHLISYDHDKDIRPLIFAHCQYSLELGQGTKIEYDFQGLERQLVDRIFFSKSFIDVGVVLKMELMVYRSDVTNQQIFEELEDKIKQETLPSKVKDVIYEESNNLPEVCRSIDALDIAIRFLRSTGGDPDMPLLSYLQDKLQMSTELTSQKAGEVSALKHCKSLWLSLNLHKTKLLVEGEQEVFDALDKPFHDELPDNCVASLHGVLKSLTEKELAMFVDKLHEFIIMKLTVNEKTYGSEYSGDSSKQKLPDWLYAYYEFDEDFVDTTYLFLPLNDILNSHCVAVWRTANTVLNSKRSN